MTKKYTEELERGYSVSTVMEEAQRCLLCYDAPCSKACPAVVFVRILTIAGKESHIL